MILFGDGLASVGLTPGRLEKWNTLEAGAIRKTSIRYTYKKAGAYTAKAEFSSRSRQEPFDRIDTSEIIIQVERKAQQSTGR